MANQEKLKSFRLIPKYTYEFMVPRKYKDSKRLDDTNKNTQ